MVGKKFAVAFPVGRYVASIANRHGVVFGGIPIKTFSNFKSNTFLSFDAVRVDAVDQSNRCDLAEFAHQPQGIVEVALDLHNFCPH